MRNTLPQQVPQARHGDSGFDWVTAGAAAAGIAVAVAIAGVAGVSGDSPVAQSPYTLTPNQ